MDFTSTLGVNAEDLGLLTDLYQLTMTACYAGERDRRSPSGDRSGSSNSPSNGPSNGPSIAQTPASFELFTRRLPQPYSYLIAMGLEQALGYLETLSFGTTQIDALKQTGIFEQAPALFWELLENARFSGDVWAVPEGTAVFAQEPLLRIEAPLWQAQLVETYLLNTLNYQTLIATRAARLRDVAGPKASLLEFGTRRAFSPQGAVWAARAAIAAGFNGTSNVLAALQLGQTPSGTMAHSLVMALAALKGSEDEAFATFHRYFPGAPLLIDTYDPVRATERLAAAVRGGAEIPAVRIDSGDLAELSRLVRSHLPQTQIFVSGDLDETAIAQLKAQNAPIDGYGLGTKLVTGAPVNGVYKLVEIGGIPVMKEAAGKGTYPGRKQVYRRFDPEGGAIADRLALASEPPQPPEPGSGSAEQPLLRCVMRGGVRQKEPESLEAIAQRTAQSVRSLPLCLREISRAELFPVIPSSALKALTEKTRTASG